MPPTTHFSWHAFLVVYCGPIILAFVLLGILLLALPHGWQFVCEYTGTIAPGPTYSSLFLALPAAARPPYGNPTSRMYGLALAVASFVFWGTGCSAAYALDVILVVYFPLFLWESLALNQPCYKGMFAACALVATFPLYAYARSQPTNTLFSTDNGLLVTGAVACAALALDKAATWRYSKEWRWKKDAWALAFAGTAAVLLSFRSMNRVNTTVTDAAFGTTTWGHACAGIALYVASVDTDVYMATPRKPLCSFWPTRTRVSAHKQSANATFL